MRIESTRRRDYAVNGALLLLLALMFTVSLLAGRVWLPLGEVWHGLMSPDANLAATIITQLRLPRAVLALEVGAALGLAGAVLQGVTRNPLAEPGLLGVSAGAALGAVIAVYFGLARLSPPRWSVRRPPLTHSAAAAVPSRWCWPARRCRRWRQPVYPWH